MKPAFGFWAARLLQEWRLWSGFPRCEAAGCNALATRYRAGPVSPGDTAVGCDFHSNSISWAEHPYATLVRETERCIKEADERPSVRAMPKSGT